MTPRIAITLCWGLLVWAIAPAVLGEELRSTNESVLLDDRSELPDGGMDDLNRDGRRDRDDIELLASLAEQFMQRPENRALVGGVGRYGKTRHQGGFVHVDTRGFRARW
jgi:hypothetical protein